jgi:hypothetical protein
MIIPSIFYLALTLCETPNCKHDEDFCYCVGDNGKAYGQYQIHKCYVDDVNRVYKTNYTHEDAFDRKKARIMVDLYLKHYCSQKRLGRTPTFEDAARIHNGGPNGHKKDATIKYAKKFKANLQSVLSP